MLDQDDSPYKNVAIDTKENSALKYYINTEDYMKSKQYRCTVYKGFNIVINEDDDEKPTSVILDSTLYCL